MAKFLRARIHICLFLVLSSVLICQGQTSPEPPPGKLAGQALNPSMSPEPGLLFYISGESDFQADFAAGGQDRPNFLSGLRIIPDGAIGRGFEADDTQLMSYWAPGNIYAQRGTLSFFWRSRYPVGPSPFPLFRVAFADHSSWDMAWLRIDYNGSGIDAFVSDVGLSRTRVSHPMDKFPGPEEWMHIAISWDETEGLYLYVNGELVAKKTVVGKVYDTGLDQLGPHSRIISPYQVQSMYNFKRGGDLDEVRIYDRMLSDSHIKGLSRGEIPESLPMLKRDLKIRKWRDAWWDRYGWNLPNLPPPQLIQQDVAIRKVEIHEAYDVKRWIWKANDGIRETTWPGVYNMSRLPGRYDYFVYPDWDCYSMSGQSIRFDLPDESWNHVEVWGKAWGQLTYENELDYDYTFGVRNQTQVKSYHRLQNFKRGGSIRFDNALIEEPIGELGVYHVSEGSAPEGSRSESFTLQHFPAKGGKEDIANLAGFIKGRYPADETSKMIGIKEGLKPPAAQADSQSSASMLPIIHLLIPYTPNSDHGLDGVEIELPALSGTPTHGELIPMNIRVKDPLWPMRDLADFSFSVKPGSPHTLWMDTRDRVLPEGFALYITLAGAGDGLTANALRGSKVRLVYKSLSAAKAEHELDRFTQIRDLFGFMVEERPSSSRLNHHNRFVADHADLMKVNPDHCLGQVYQYAKTRKLSDRPEYKIPEPPPGIPAWAFLQVEYLRHLEHLCTYYIDQRQISNGEFGGGLSDDDDFSNLLVGAALMGIEPGKIGASLRLLLESYYDQDRDPYDAALRQRSLPLFTNGLATISTDLLHAYEEGIEAVGQLMLLEYGNPLYMSRGMEIAKRVLDDVTQMAPDGHRHFRSRLFGGTSMSLEDPWQWAGHYSYNILHTPYLIARYNGNPLLRKMIIELADALLDHRDKEGNFYPEIHFFTGEKQGEPGLRAAWQVFMAAYEFSGDPKYLPPIEDRVSGSRPFDPEDLEKRYAEKIRDLAVLEHPNTVGSIWIDRISCNTNMLQADRLGGVALARIRHIYPKHHVSWDIKSPANYESLALYLPESSSGSLEIIGFNMEKDPVNAAVTLWDIQAGYWRVISGPDEDGDREMDLKEKEELFYLERGSHLPLTFAPRVNTLVHMELAEPAATDYNQRPDLAIHASGIHIKGDEVDVRVYSQGAIETPETTLEVWDAQGQLVGVSQVPAIRAPLELNPNWINIRVKVPAGTDLSKGSIKIDPDGDIEQITHSNCQVSW